MSHFQEQLRIYKRQLCVSLLDLTGVESRLAQAYKFHTISYDNPDLLFCEFDFHAETRGNNFDNAIKCIERVESTLQQME